jgi:hypothetical protein
MYIRLKSGRHCCNVTASHKHSFCMKCTSRDIPYLVNKMLDRNLFVGMTIPTILQGADYVSKANEQSKQASENNLEPGT